MACKDLQASSDFTRIFKSRCKATRLRQLVAYLHVRNRPFRPGFRGLRLQLVQVSASPACLILLRPPLPACLSLCSVLSTMKACHINASAVLGRCEPLGGSAIFGRRAQSPLPACHTGLGCGQLQAIFHSLSPRNAAEGSPCCSPRIVGKCGVRQGEGTTVEQ